MSCPAVRNCCPNVRRARACSARPLASRAERGTIICPTWLRALGHKWGCSSDDLTYRSGRPVMDALSETLRVVRLVGAIFINGRFTAPWCYQSPSADSAAPLLEPGAERVVIFHLITEGECYVEMGDEPPVRLTAGDAVIFPNGDAHRMTSQPGLPPAKGARLDQVLCAPSSATGLRRRWADDTPRLRLPGLRCSAGRDAACGASRAGAGQRTGIECRYLARSLGSLCSGRSPLTSARRCRRLGQARRGAVHRGIASLHE